MPLRYSQLRENVSKVDHAEVKELLLCDDKSQEVEESVLVLVSLDSANMELQSKRTTILGAQNLFDGPITKFPSFTSQMS